MRADLNGLCDGCSSAICGCYGVLNSAVSSDIYVYPLLPARSTPGVADLQIMYQIPRDFMCYLSCKRRSGANARGSGLC